MKKFLAIYHVPAGNTASMDNATPEQQANVMKAWMDWKAQHEKHIVDFGAPLLPSQIVSANSQVQGGDAATGGYSILQAESAEALKAAFKDHPHLGWTPNATIHISEFAPMPS